MNSKKSIVFALLIFFIISAVAFAVVTVPASMRYREFSQSGQKTDTATPVNGVSAIGFVCSSANCATVSQTLDLSTGAVLSDVSNPPMLYTATDSMNIYYPTTLQSSYGYGVYVYKDGYIPWEVSATWAGEGTVSSRTYYLAKKQGCSSPIINFNVVNNVYKNMPLIVDLDASLSADTISALTSGGPLDYVPPQLLDKHYSVNTSVTLVIIKSNLEESVRTETKYVLIPYSGSKHVSFSWTPTVDGDYTATVTTGVPDAKCIQSSVVPQSQSKDFKVWPVYPKNACYTNLNGLAYSPAFPVAGDSVSFTFNKLSNYANNYDIWDPLYHLTPLKTNVIYTITDSAGEVFRQEVQLPANSDSYNTASAGFSWTAAAAGSYTASVSGTASDPICTGLSNPTETLSTTFAVSPKVTDTTPPTISITYPSNGQVFTAASIAVSGTASDNVGVSKVEVKVGAGSWLDATGTTSWSRAVVLLEGSNTIYARATDTSGNSKEASVTVTYSPPPVCTRANPAVTITPSSQTGNAGQKITYTVSVKNNDNAICGSSSFGLSNTCPSGSWTCTLSKTSVAVASGATDSSTTIDVTSPPDSITPGTFSVTAANSLDSGYSGTGSATYVVVDNITPTITITYPADGQSFSVPDITVTGTASDNVGVSKVEVKVGAGSWLDATGTTSWSRAVVLLEGSNTIYARATDTSGNSKEASVTVTYTLPDIAPPEITIVSPLNTTYNKTWIWANVTLNEAGSWCGVSLNGGLNDTLSSTSETYWYLKLLGLTDGPNSVKFYCSDIAGNINSAEIIFTVDTTPPQILELWPFGIVNTNYPELGAFTDESATCKYDTYDTNYASMANTFATTGTTVHSQALTLADGAYTYYLRCIDSAGNANTESNRTAFTVFTAARIEISASDVKVNQTDVFSLPILLNNTGFKNAIGNLTLDIPAGLVNSSGSTFLEFNIAPGAPQTYTPSIEAVMWGDYYINLTAKYNSSTVTKQVLVQSIPIPIYEFRFAYPDAIAVGDDADVVVALFNRGIINGYNVPLNISTSGELTVVGAAQTIIPEVRGNDTDYANATYVSFKIRGVSAGTGTINITVDGRTQTKSVIVRDARLTIDVSVKALAPFNMSLGRLFEVSGTVYNTGSETVLAVRTKIDLESGLKNMTQSSFYNDTLPPTINGVPPAMFRWIVNGTEPGFKQINISVSFSDSLLNTYNVSDSVYVNILQFSDPAAPFIDITAAHSPKIIFGAPFTINATLKNIGNDVAYNTVAAIENIGSLTVLSTNPPSLDLGDFSRDEEKNVSWTINATHAGTYNAIISASPTGHRFEESITFSVVYLHDVSISEMSAPATATEGNTVAISAILRNLGATDETNVPVIFSVDGAAAQTRYYNISIGENKTAEFNWAAAAGTHTLSLYANLTSDGNSLNNNASAVISVNPIVQPPITTSSGGGGMQYSATQIIKSNKDAYFSNISIPDSIISGEQLWASGCVYKLDKNSTVEFYLDGFLKSSIKTTVPSICFNLSAGTPTIGNHTAYLWLNSSNIDLTKTVNVIKGQLIINETGGEEINFANILTEDTILVGVPTTIRVFVGALKPSNVSVALFSDGALIGQKDARVSGEAAILFNHTFNETGERTLRAFVRVKDGETRLALKKIVVQKSLPTGSFLSRTLKNPWTALFIIMLVAGSYYALKKKRVEPKTDGS